MFYSPQQWPQSHLGLRIQSTEQHSRISTCTSELCHSPWITFWSLSHWLLVKMLHICFFGKIYQEVGKYNESWKKDLFLDIFRTTSIQFRKLWYMQSLQEYLDFKDKKQVFPRRQHPALPYAIYSWNDTITLYKYCDMDAKLTQWHPSYNDPCWAQLVPQSWSWEPREGRGEGTMMWLNSKSILGFSQLSTKMFSTVLDWFDITRISIRLFN